MASFTTGELEVMQILWEEGELKPAQIQEKYPRPIKNAALRFQLKILLEKGHVSRRKNGKAYYYTAATPRKGAFKRMVQRMADIYCQGSCAGLIAELIKTQKLSDEEIQTLRELAETRQAGGTKS
ncbi:MAG: BlaI/MecI/CopY family transcriptional regulator [Phycisphaerae bacterium]|nr:BlaI/MecI/CopY family transcriptional regulator [Phycisphaerae bacterium]